MRKSKRVRKIRVQHNKRKVQGPVKLRRASDIEARLDRRMKDLTHDQKYIHKHLDKIWEHVATTNARLYQMEAQVNMLSRLVTSVCMEKLGMKLKTFRRLIERLEREAIADSEIRDLQELFEMEDKDGVQP